MTESDQPTSLVADALEIITADPELIQQYPVSLDVEVAFALYKKFSLLEIAKAVGNYLTDVEVVNPSIDQDARSRYQESINKEVFDKLGAATVAGSQVRVNLSFREIDFWGRERVQIIRHLREYGSKSLISHARDMRNIFKSAAEGLFIVGEGQTRF